MSGQLPVPEAQAFIVCRRIIEDGRTGDYLLVAPVTRISLPRSAFPIQLRTDAYAVISSAHGHYELSLALQDADGETIWNWQPPGGVSQPNPLRPHELGFYDLLLPLPQPGKYELALLATGQPIARHGIWMDTVETQ
jgi:hypothetical protein